MSKLQKFHCLDQLRERILNSGNGGNDTKESLQHEKGQNDLAKHIHRSDHTKWQHLIHCLFQLFGLSLFCITDTILLTVVDIENPAQAVVCSANDTLRLPHMENIRSNVIKLVNSADEMRRYRDFDSVGCIMERTVEVHLEITRPEALRYCAHAVQWRKSRW